MNSRVSVVIGNDPSRFGTSFGGGGDDRKRPERHAPGRAHQKEALQLPPKRQKIYPVEAQKGRRKQQEGRIDDDDDDDDNESDESDDDDDKRDKSGYLRGKAKAKNRVR